MLQLVTGNGKGGLMLEWDVSRQECECMTVTTQRAFTRNATRYIFSITYVYSCRYNYTCLHYIWMYVSIYYTIYLNMNICDMCRCAFVCIDIYMSTRIHVYGSIRICMDAGMMRMSVYIYTSIFLCIFLYIRLHQTSTGTHIHMNTYTNIIYVYVEIVTEKFDWIGERFTADGSARMCATLRCCRWFVLFAIVLLASMPQVLDLWSAARFSKTSVRGARAHTHQSPLLLLTRYTPVSHAMRACTFHATLRCVLSSICGTALTSILFSALAELFNSE